MEDKTSKEDDLRVAADTCKVVGSKNIFNNLYWLMGLVIILMVTIIFFSGEDHKKEVSIKSIEPTNAKDFRSELAINLAKLKKIEKQAKQDFKKLRQHTIKEKVSKAYLARQNAPTNMYSTELSSLTLENNLGLTNAANPLEKRVTAALNNQNKKKTSVIPHPAYTIASGEFMHAVLETAIHSDLPGMVRAVVSQPVYAYVGTQPLIPSGSRLIGHYTSHIIAGQQRIMVIWDRVILPDGLAIQVNSLSADNLGRVGQGADSINTHFFARFGEATLLSVIGAGAATAGVSSDEQYNSMAHYRMAVGDSFRKASEQSLHNTLPIKPSLHVYQGAKITVFVAHDLSFYDMLRKRNA